MNLEKHNICLWNNGLDKQSNLIDLIKNRSDKGIKILSVKNYSIDLNSGTKIQLVGEGSNLINIEKYFVKFLGSNIQKRLSEVLITYKLPKEIKLTVDVDPITFN